MSASARYARKTETKRKWEARLKEFENPILYLRAIIMWQKPVEFGVLLALTSLFLWFAMTASMTVVTMLSLATVTWFVIGYLSTVFAFTVPWNALLTNQSNSDGTPPDHLGEVVGLLVTVKYAIVDAVENCERIKASNPGKFVGQVTVTGITLAWIGSWFSGCTLILFLVYALLLTPGVINNRLPQKGYIVVEPYLRVYIAIAKEKLNKLLAMAKQRVSAPQPASALQPASTPPAIPDTPVAAAEKTQEQKKVD